MKLSRALQHWPNVPNVADWLSRNKFAATVSLIAPLIAFSVPTSAIAQTNSTDESFLQDLYSFLETHSAGAHQLAIGYEEHESTSNITTAKAVCGYYSNGLGLKDAWEVYNFVPAMFENEQNSIRVNREQVEFIAQLYFGTVANIGASYYCPEHHTQVIEDLRAM